MADLHKLTDDLKRVRDEIKLKIHLGSKEAQNEWADLEKRWTGVSREGGARPHRRRDGRHRQAARIGSEGRLRAHPQGAVIGGGA